MKEVKANDLSIYIHWPFCLSKCPYCDFNSHIANSIDDDNWLKSYEKEIEYFKDIIQNKYVRSIFFWWRYSLFDEPQNC